jgi:lysine 2,3-aminomutase
MRHRLLGLEALLRHLGAAEPADPSGVRAAHRYRMAVTPYYAGLIRRADARDPIFRLCAAAGGELRAEAETAADPFGERRRMPVPGVIRRYRDRCVLLATSACPVYCRHCTRKHGLSGRRAHPRLAPLRDVARYLRRHPEIREVIVSGGDPLTLPTPRLDRLLAALRRGTAVEILRLGTRAPVTLPQRVTPELARMLRRHRPLWLNTHFNHPVEITPDAVRACERLADAGIPLGNQTVLLRGVNDDADTLEALFRGLLRARVRPYYLLQCDPVAGVGHFRVGLSRGRAIMRELRGRLSGLALPAYVADRAGADSKIRL